MSVVEMLRKNLPKGAKKYINKIYKTIKYPHTDCFDLITERNISKYGFSIYTYKWDGFTNYHIDLFGEYDPALSNIVWKNINPKTTFIDVGAHTGWFSMLASKKAAEVISFEPNPEMFLILSLNASRVQNIKPIPMAASDRDGEFVRINIGRHNNTGNTTIVQENIDRTKTKEAIAITTTIDSAIKRYSKRPDDVFIKIDVEGYEAKVLRGARITLQNAENSKILVEIVPWKIENAGDNPWDLINELANDASSAVLFMDGKEHKVHPERLLEEIQKVYNNTKNKKDFKADIYVQKIHG